MNATQKYRSGRGRKTMNKSNRREMLNFAKWVFFLVANVATIAYLCYASTTGELDAVMQPIQSFYESIGVK